ncbi:hypothetical protein CONLIGDRAFT_140471 [Coniochaeta ligniaria NRRL 30616]|uniref:Uncharacterized protein n=1 Tax=Coniochaeta ligniaria NRRL 30616 TaxID=1408157 RepID=A0A1J7J3E5_9PEZI|nr:hypothetical protein CONLIGDRAFT_140471 [Coniochaeta ligniaria NRRL 30616]
MDSNDPPRRPPLHNSSSSNSLSRISIVSDITDYNWYGDDYRSPTAGRRESLESLQSSDGEQPRGADDVTSPLRNESPGWSPFSGSSNGGYEPVPVTGNAPKPARKPSRGFGFGNTLKKRAHETIPEEDDGIDMGQIGLLKHAEPIGGDDQDRAKRGAAGSDADGPPVDYSITLGPSTWQDEEFMKRLQEHEAQGKLTGGIGLGIRSDTTVKESELLATSPVAERAPRTPLSRSFSLARNKSSLGRGATLKRIGQSEANKSGQVIEVIIEEEPPATPVHHSMTDLSSMSGPAGMNQPGMRQSTFPTNTQRKEIFYPQPDWKPFSMRWPYLLGLVVLSAGLGVAQEAVYQTSIRTPLMTFHTPHEIPPLKYFAFKFLPTIISVSYGILWQITDFEVKRLEAFYQLSKEGGALAAESINVDYITHWSFLRPFRAFYCKHYAVFVSAIATILANALVPTLGAASIMLSPSREERLKNPLNEKSIVINPVYSRMLTTTLLLIALLGCVLYYQLQSRKSGLLADVKGIAGLASMAVVSHILMDFKDMDVATHKDIHHRLKDHRYVLRNSSLAPDDDNPPTTTERDRFTKSHLSENPHPLMLRAAGAVPFLVGIALFLSFIPVFLFTKATILTDRAPWVVTALAVCVKLSWSSLETDIRLMEPYYILSRRHAPPRTLTLDYTAMPFGWVAAAALANGHWVVFLVGFGSVLAEFFTVLATSLATVEGRDFVAVLDDKGRDPAAGEDINAGQETAVSFWVTLGMAVLILVYMFAAAAVVFARRRKVFLPRQPNTIASVLAFIHQSKMLYDFVGTAKMNGAQMGRRLDEIGKTYGLGWFRGRDGLPHCGVDEEELLSRYRFEYDYSKATNPWEERPVEWL